MSRDAALLTAAKALKMNLSRAAQAGVRNADAKAPRWIAANGAAL
ncbi:MAG: hypothetical protein KC448_00030 [Yoonia sp.]|nr:hypothetical protein [Yoonia sp.]